MTLLDRFRPGRRPPGVAYSDPAVRALVDSAEPWRPVIGVDARRRPVTAGGPGGLPHLFVTAPAGRGASALLRCVGAQALRDGARVVVLDHQRQEQAWADGLPGVEYHRDVDDIHAALLMLDAQVATRGDTVLERPVVVLVESARSLASRLRLFWRRDADEHGGGPSPAVEALTNLLVHGRAAGVSVVASGPALDRVTRAQTTRLVHPAWSATTWRLHTTAPAPAPDRTVGRWHLVTDDEVQPAFQGVYLTDDEARTVARRSGGAP